MSIYQLNFNGMTLLGMSIERLKAFEPKEGYYLAFSGGKDSVKGARELVVLVVRWAGQKG